MINQFKIEYFDRFVNELKLTIYVLGDTRIIDM
jgi:hypothetical protein